MIEDLVAIPTPAGTMETFIAHPGEGGPFPAVILYMDVWGVREELYDIARGVAAVGISSNDVTQFPEDGPEKMKEEARTAGYTFPYLFDETQEVAKEYRAACTPDFFVFDKDRRLVYRGQMDDSRPNSGRPVTGKDLRAALDAVLAGRPVSADQKPSLGCNIKWKEKNAPEYAALVSK